MAKNLAAMKLGKLPPRHDPRTLRLASYLAPTIQLPAVPESVWWSKAVQSWPMLGNDRYGDCAWAGPAHMEQAWAALTKKKFTPTDAMVLKDYSSTGFDPRTGTHDDGTVMLDMLNRWRNVGICGGRKIYAYVAVDPHNHDEVKLAMMLFGGLAAGVALPKTAQTQQFWQAPVHGPYWGSWQPGSWGGHMIPYLDFDLASRPTPRIRSISWGGIQELSWNWHDVYCDELYAVLGMNWASKTIKAPSGFYLDDLRADLRAVAA